MDILVVKNAVGPLDKLLSQTKRALWEIEREVFHVYDYGDKEGSYEYPRGALAGHLQQLYNILLVVLEAAQMPEARTALLTSWQTFTSQNKDLGKTNDHGETLRAPHSPTLTT